MDTQYGRPRHRVSYRVAQGIESQRSPRAVAIDNALQAREQFRKGESDYSDWAKDPSRSDIQGIDSARNLPPIQREVISRREFEKTEITPFVKRLYSIWHDQYSHDKANGIKRKALTELALQRYLDSREAAFEMNGGSKDVFKDKMDEIDIATASDSWSNLDSELMDKGLFYEDNSQEEFRQRAREERDYERGYEEYIRAGRAG